MALDVQLYKLFEELIQNDSAEFLWKDCRIIVRLVDHATKIFLTTSVYQGSNFIPKSVRKSLSHPILKGRDKVFKTFFQLDEGRYSILINYIGKVDGLNTFSLKRLLEDFGRIAEIWRVYLDEHDRHDLLPIFSRNPL